MVKYAIIIKTGEAEIRAIENTRQNVLSKIFPIIEITRGRRVTKNEKVSYPFENRLKKLKEALNGLTVCFDLTSDETLTSAEIDVLYDPSDGYQNWVNFLVKIKEENIFQEIVPSILLNAEDPSFEENLIMQIQNLKKHFNSILYRNSIIDENCYDDFELIKEYLKDLQLYVVIDCGYAPQASHINISQKCISRINNLKTIIGNSPHYIVCSTSFPNNVSEIGSGDTDIFNISEINIQDSICKEIPEVIYGDYASINPVRNDTVIMARGWIPRIDIPLKTSIYYYRQRRLKGVSAYASTYNRVAQSVINDNKFPGYLTKNWGINQVLNCAEGGAPSSSPSFWISVRMNIFIEQQVIRVWEITSN